MARSKTDIAWDKLYNVHKELCALRQENFRLLQKIKELEEKEEQYKNEYAEVQLQVENNKE